MSTRAPYLSSLAAVLLLLAAAVPALAHAELVSSNPKAGSTVTDVRAITLKFSEALDSAESSFKLVGPDGSTIGTGTVVSPKVMMLPGVSIGPGEYTVKWTSAATDGHIARGTFSFTVEAPATTPEPATPAPATEAPAATGAASAAPAPSEGPAASEATAVSAAPTDVPAASAAPSTEPAASSGTDILFPIVGLVVIVAVVGVLVLRRSRAA